MRDLKSNLAGALSLAPETYDASANGEAVDLKGGDSATFVIVAGDWTDGAHAFSAEHRASESDDWAAVPADDLIGTFPTVEGDGESPEAGVNDNDVHLVGYRGGLRFVRAVVTVTGSPETGAAYGVGVVRGHLHLAPAA